MASLTKQHMVDAAEQCRMIDDPKRRAFAVNMFIEFFRRWNPLFDSERFRIAATPESRDVA